MKAFLRGRTYYVKLRTADGTWVQLATGTQDRRVANEYAAMLERIGQRGSQEWDLIHAVCARPPRLSLAALYAASRTGELRSLRVRLNDVDLEPWVEPFLKSRTGLLRPDTVAHYRVHLRHFFPDGQEFWRSAFTTPFVRSGLDALDKSPGTKRKYRAALLAFVDYLEQRDILTENPVSRAKVSGRLVVRDRFIEHAALLKTLVAMPEPYRSVAAILHATGADMSQLLGVTVADVEEGSKQLQLRHGKTNYRNRSVLVMDWAWPYVLDSLKRAREAGADSNARLFPTVNRYTLSDRFREACAAVKIADYSLRDARHSYAVELLKAGGSPQAVARQLGHADTTLVHRVYGRYMPADAEVQEAHRKVARRARQSRAERRAIRGTA